MLKATGIVRRMDELGRIVIPKEIRRAQTLREGDPMEIYTTEDSIVIKKYSPLEKSDIDILIEKTTVLLNQLQDGTELAKNLQGYMQALQDAKAALEDKPCLE